MRGAGRATCCGGLSIGAPPDLFNPRGQDWGLTGFSPRALVAGGFAPFLATLRAALRHAGGVRIDHAMGLTRLWLIPDGADPADGAYLTYPLDDLLRLLALESQRHRRDRRRRGSRHGTGRIPRDAGDRRPARHARAVVRARSARLLPPDAWDHSAVAMTSTHDLPTVAGWWHGSDIVDARRMRAARRRRERSRRGGGTRTGSCALVAGLRATQGVADGDAPPPDDTQPVRGCGAGVHRRARRRRCACRRSRTCSASRSSRTCRARSIEHPNWRRRLTAGRGRLARRAARRGARAAQLAARRPRL